MSNNDAVSLAADINNEEPFSDSNEMIPVDEPVEHSFTTDDGTEIVMSVEKVPYGNSQQPIMRSARANSASAAPSSLFNPVDKSFIVEHKDGTKYFFNTDQKITSIEQNGVTKYTYLYNSAGQVRRVEDGTEPVLIYLITTGENCKASPIVPEPWLHSVMRATYWLNL
jgi:hypothetical protein